MTLRPFYLLLALLPDLVHANTPLTNERYRADVDSQGNLTVTNLTGGRALFRPEFTVIRAANDPKIAMRYLNIPGVRYHAPSWITEKQVSALAQANTQIEGGDGFVAEVQKGDTQGRTVDIFRAGETTVVQASTASIQDGKITWDFPKDDGFTLSASLDLPPGTGEPKLSYSFRPEKSGWYSLGFTGAPAVSLEKADEIWQPLIWQEKRFPDESVLTPAGYCTLPATFTVQNGTAVGVVADPEEMPFMPLPRWDNSLFAVALRDPDGKARPMIFSPMLGGKRSQMNAGDDYRFQTRLFAGEASVAKAYEAVSRSIYGFSDYRRNAGVSLNTVIENMVDYGLSEASRFDRELKGCMYETDVPGAVKNVSSLHPLEMAVVMDNESIFRERALPILEYLLSREKFLFVLDRHMKIQNPSRRLFGPCAEASEFAAAYSFSGNQNPLLLEYARTITARKLKSKHADRWVQVLALYHATGEPKLLAEARDGADLYLNERLSQAETSFDRSEAGDFFFWTSYAPLWINLLDLFEETGEKRYLEAAHKGALAFTQYVMMSPRIPEGDVTVNPDGKAPFYAYLKSKGHVQMDEPAETVPAWRVSEIGLTPESSPTVISHRGIFMTNHAAWMLRLAEYTKDRFLHDVARSAVVGRYENFPGYHINTDRTTVYEKAGYPYHGHKELSYNSFHYNHVWPHATLLLDYLVSDVFTKSQGAIKFPGRYAQGYGYLQSRIYGDRPGTFQGEMGVRLWMPKGLLKVENPQINYLSARRGNTLFVALANQAPQDITTRLTLNPNFVQLPAGQPPAVRVWRNNQPASSPHMEDGSLSLSVPAGGLVAIAIEGITPIVAFQDRFAEASGTTSQTTPLTLRTGDARAMILSFGPGLANAYVYLRETDDTLESASLSYRQGTAWTTVADSKYPFEFSIPLDPKSKTFEFALETTGKDGTVQKSENTSLPLSSSLPAGNSP